MIYFFKYRKLKKAFDEMVENGVGETLLHNLVMEPGEFKASFENKTFTRIIAKWAYESLKQYNAENFLTLTFNTDDDKDFFVYELTVRKMGSQFLTPAQKLEKLEKRIKELEEEHEVTP